MTKYLKSILYWIMSEAVEYDSKVFEGRKVPNAVSQRVNVEVLGVTVYCIKVVAKQSRHIVGFKAEGSWCAEITIFV